MATPSVSNLSCLKSTDLTFFATTDNTTDLVKITPSNTAVSSTDTAILTFTSEVPATTEVVLRNVHDPELAQDAATKNYVDSIAGAGVSWKNAVVALQDTEIATWPPTDGITTVSSIDGASLTIGERVLYTGETTAPELNGIWEITAGTWIRPTDYPTGGGAAGAAIFVTEGTTYGDTAWVATADTGADIIDTNDPLFTQFSAAPSVAGSDTQIQFNQNNTHGASDKLVWNRTANTLIVTGDAVGEDALEVATGDIAISSDSAFLNIGAGPDLSLTHDGTNSIIDNNTGELQIQNDGTGNLSLFQVGVGDIVIDNQNTTAGSDILLILGTSNVAAEADTAIRFQTNAADDIFSVTNDTVVTFNIDGDTTDAAVGTFTVNAANDAMDTLTPMFTIAPSSATEALTTFGTGNDVLYNDSVEARFGSTTTAGDFVIVHDGTDSTMTNSTGSLNMVLNDTTNNGNNILIDNTGTGATGAQGIILQTGSTDSNTSIELKNDTTTLLKMDGAGGNATSTTTGAIQITGGLGVTQSVYADEFCASSDATLKTNIEPLRDPLRVLNKIEGYSYDWIDEEANKRKNNPKQWGHLAQQLEEIGLDHLVSDGEVKAVNYNMLIPLIIEAIKELTRLTLDEVEE